MAAKKETVAAAPVVSDKKKALETAMQQIRERQYPNSLLQYTGNILLVAINYDEKTKEHVCKIEEYAKIQN